MSCFIVTNEHINALASFAALHYQYERDAISYPSPDDLGRALMIANARAFATRYQDGASDAERAIKEYQYIAPAAPVDPVAALKLLSCYEYQTCELDDWDKSLIKRKCEQLRDWIISQLPGYESADWAI